MRPTSWLLAAAAATLMAGAAQAQGMAPGDGAPAQAQGMAPGDAAAMPASSAAMPASATGAPLGSADHPIPQTSPTPADQAFHLKAGDPSVVSNSPVPDTPENRAAYGQPMSHGGKATKAAGN